MAETYSERMRRELGDDLMKRSPSRSELADALDILVEKFAEIDARLGKLEGKK